MARSPIAVVDDDESVRRSTRLLLESFGYQAAVFESTEGFLRFGPLRDTSCLLLDVHMPGMDGLRLQSQLVAKGCGIPSFSSLLTTTRSPVGKRCKTVPSRSWASL